MELPFTHDAFLDVFGAYNALLWPAVDALWLWTAWTAWRWLYRGASARTAFALLTVHWAWSGIAYHWVFFRAINPAASLFAGLFIVQAIGFGWLAATARGRLTAALDLRSFVGGALLFYGLIYPAVGLILGLRYPRAPIFAVPCPTTLVTAGLLVVSGGIPRMANIVPILWAVIGSSAAFAMGIRADTALVVAAVVLALDTIRPSALGLRSAGRVSRR